jgi:flavin reductase (DIM6/NTAB) family NADH-FMN oxidoreductase RutF
MAVTGRRVELQEFTGRDFRDTMGAFATGVSVVTTRGEEHPHGMTVSSFSSVSLDPPLVLVCIANTSEGSGWITRNGVFAVNILSLEQEPLSRHFASKDRPRGADAFLSIAHRAVVSGSPILEGAAAYVDCRLADSHTAGDHFIFIGEVLAVGVDLEATPLVFHRGRYAVLSY